MAVPIDVIDKASGGDKQSIRLIEKEYGGGDGQKWAVLYMRHRVDPLTGKIADIKSDGTPMEMQYTESNQQLINPTVLRMAAKGDPYSIKVVEDTLAVENGEGVAKQMLWTEDPMFGMPDLQIERQPYYNQEYRMAEKKPTGIPYYNQEYRMAERKPTGMIERAEFDESPKLLTAEERQKKKEREELEKLFKSRGL